MITSGATVQVVPQPGPPNPWIDQKIGWVGIAGAELVDLPCHIRVMVSDRERPDIMPIAALRVVPADAVGAGPRACPLPTAPHAPDVAKAGQPRGVAPTVPAAIPAPKPEPLVIPPDAPVVRVRDTAGSGDGEAHIVRRRGQIGSIIAEGTEAAGFRYVAFPGSPLWVLMPATALVPVATQQKIKTTVRQLGLPM